MSDELYRLLKEEEEEDGQIVSLGDSRIERVHGCLACLSMLTVGVVVLAYSQLHKKAYNLVICEFGDLKCMV